MKAQLEQRYFDLDDNLYVKGRWHLVDPTDQSGADVSVAFWQGKLARIATPVRLQHSDAVERGNPLDYTVISGDRIPVVSVRVAEIFERLAPDDVAFVPAMVDGFPEQYFVVNVLTVRRCIDEAACDEFEKFTEEDRAIFPEKVGRYRLVWGLKIDKSKVQDAKVFWTWGWSALIVNEEIKNAFKVARVRGAKFVEV